MNTTTLICTITTLLSSYQSPQAKKTSTKEVVLPAKYYKVLKIESINHHYIISTVSNKYIYKIVSNKSNSNSCKNLIIGQQYMLKLKPYLNEVNLSDAHMNAIQLEDGTHISLEDDAIKDVFFTQDISGLCFIGKK